MTRLPSISDPERRYGSTAGHGETAHWSPMTPLHTGGGVVQTGRLVVAEDHRIAREGLRSVLERQAHLPIVGKAQDGPVAIRCAEESTPDLRVPDTAMPKRSGLAVLRDRKSRCPEVRIIAPTVRRTDETVEEVFWAEADGYGREEGVLKLVGEGHDKKDIGELSSKSPNMVEQANAAPTVSCASLPASDAPTVGGL